jgi:hypothetical protein
MKRPIVVILVSVLFIAIGIANLFKAIAPLVGGHITSHELMDSGLVFLSAVLALLGGIFMLRAANWARWFVLIWMALHVVLSIFHKPVELAIHSLILVILIGVLLFGSGGRYFSHRTAQ